MPYKRAQLQIGEIVAVLVVFFIITIIGFVVYFNVLRSEVEEQTEEFGDISSIGVVQTVLSLPELQCSENNVVKENCVDKLKVEAAAGNPTGSGIMSDAAGKAYYFDVFGFSKISIKKIYPAPQVSVVLYDNPPNSIRSELKTNIPITIYDPVEKRNLFGILEATSYLR